MKIETLILDNDGVLVDTEKIYYKACRETLSEEGIDLSPEQFIDISLTRGSSVFDGHNFTPDKFRHLRKSRNTRYSELLKTEVTLFPLVRETLAELHHKVRIVVVTCSLKEHFDIIHQSTGIRKFFNAILTREDFIKTKPDPEPYLTAINSFSLKPEHCIVIEDSPRGVQSAKAAGLRTYQYTGNHNFSGVKTPADGKLNCFSEIKSLISLI